jgi:hypothetical protein
VGTFVQFDLICLFHVIFFFFLKKSSTTLFFRFSVFILGCQSFCINKILNFFGNLMQEKVNISVILFRKKCKISLCG